MNDKKNITESNNIKSQDIDMMSIREIIGVFKEDNEKILSAINDSDQEIEFSIKQIVKSINDGGRLFYVGAGTSGRLGVLDAAECNPTFGVGNEMIQGIIAGGQEALVSSIEGAEDQIDDIKLLIKKKSISSIDFVFGISCSGRALFVHEFLKEAKHIGANTTLLTFNDIDDQNYIDNIIKVYVGPEILSGSTRMKSGTATKMILNMISTITMIRLNKTYGNYMVDLKIVNKKLHIRAINIIKELTGITSDQAEIVLKNANGNVKNALAMELLNINYFKSVELLDIHDGSLRNVLNTKESN